MKGTGRTRMTYSHVRTVSTAHASASAQTERKRHTIRAFRIRFTLPEKWKPGAEPRNWRIGPSKQPVISLGKQAERNGQPAGRAKWNIVELKRRPILLSPSGYAYYPRSIRANNTFKSGKYLANGPPSSMMRREIWALVSKHHLFFGFRNERETCE